MQGVVLALSRTDCRAVSLHRTHQLSPRVLHRVLRQNGWGPGPQQAGVGPYLGALILGQPLAKLLLRLKIDADMHQRILLVASLVCLFQIACSTSTTTQADQNGKSGAGGTAGDENAGASGDSNVQAGGTSAVGGANSAPRELGCSSYCTSVQQSCLTESVKQYKSDESCLNSCAAFPLGTIKDTRGNTLGCRAQYAQLAAVDPVANCSAAGPSGGGHCGTNCDAYCALMARVCGSAFDDDAACRTACLAMVGVDEVTYKYGGSGDNLQCRIYHSTFGAEGFPEIHCPHASPVPMAPCANL